MGVEAEAVADADPFHAHDIRKYEMREWEVHQILGAGPFSVAAIAPMMGDDPDRFRSLASLGH